LVDAVQQLELYDMEYVTSFARQWYVLVAYWKHMEWRLSLEQFMQLWDAGLDLLGEWPEHMDMFAWSQTQEKSSVLWNKYWNFAPVYIERYLQLDDMRWANTVFILEKKVREGYAKQELLQAAIEERWSNVVLI
jgi:hypothetical protein